MTAPDGVSLAATHDVVGIGLGPFNLGLAALAAPLDLDAVFFEAKPTFSWHPGLLLDGTTLQVPFLADLVTLADPTSRFSFLNYLHEQGRLYRFYFYERFQVPRREYDAYCRWVADQLGSCRFSSRVVGIHAADARRGADTEWIVEVETATGTEWHGARSVVLGVGSTPTVPACARDHLGDHVLHSAGYRPARDRLLAEPIVTVIGSGQSAAEVILDQLRSRPASTPLEWFTRSRGFLPMEYSKLGLELFTPEYASWFHQLDEVRRDELRRGQDLLYKGISEDTSAAIFDELYERTIDGADAGLVYAPGCELVEIEATPAQDHRLRLHLRQRDDGRRFTRATDALVLATGYEPAALPLAPGAAACVEHDARGRPVVERDYRLRRIDGQPSSVFVQNGELHTHGVGAPDLGLGAHRSAVILNTICARPVYAVHERNVFQTFGVPDPREPSP